MKKKILKHRTITGFVKKAELTKFDVLEEKLANAKENLQIAEKNVSKARNEMNVVIKEVYKRIESEKKELTSNMKNKNADPDLSSVLRFDDIKSKYEQTIANLELRKNNISKKIEGYKADGTERWDTLKNKLNHELEELGKVLKGFTQPAK